MTRHRRTWILAAACVSLTIAGGIALAQPWMRRGGARGIIPDDRAGIPNWSNDAKYKKDVFTFCRVEYDSGYGGGFPGGGFPGGGRRFRGGGRGGWNWLTDFPDSDLNFSFRLQQLTSLKVNPDPVTRRLTDPDLGDFPFLYMIEPGRGLLFSEAEVKAFRNYLLNGGFLMVDDFWGDQEYATFYNQIKRVFPEREPQELGLDHEIFRIVYRLKEKPQVPSIHSWQGPGSEVTWEEWGHGGDTRTVHYQGIFDDKGRMMVLICHNTDLGDGWEREGEDVDYFHEFSEKKSYPMGINIVTYAMTH
jgi:hypothetical protein